MKNNNESIAMFNITRRLFRLYNYYDCKSFIIIFNNTEILLSCSINSELSYVLHNYMNSNEIDSIIKKLKNYGSSFKTKIELLITDNK